MALITPSEIRNLANQFRQSDWRRVTKSDPILLSELKSNQDAKSTFDVFLSHSFKDAQMVLGVYSLLTREGFSVYVDWIVDPHLERAAVSPATAEQVRSRMRQSKTLIYAHSLNSATSTWMPWELGFFDGFRSAVAILPISANGGSTKGIEYLSLYPYIDLRDATTFLHRGEAPERFFGRSRVNDVKTLNEWVAEKRIA